MPSFVAKFGLVLGVIILCSVIFFGARMYFYIYEAPEIADRAYAQCLIDQYLRKPQKTQLDGA